MSSNTAPQSVNSPRSVTFRCVQCQGTSRAILTGVDVPISCSQCNAQPSFVAGAFQEGQLERCPICGCDELFIRKDFPQRLGVAIVVVGFVISSVTWYFHMFIATFAILMLTALIDVLLYMLMGDVLECYRCHAQFRGATDAQGFSSFDLEIHEKHRQMKARQAHR